jgi:hypothetical protein
VPAVVACPPPSGHQSLRRSIAAQHSAANANRPNTFGGAVGRDRNGYDGASVAERGGTGTGGRNNSLSSLTRPYLKPSERFGRMRMRMRMMIMRMKMPMMLTNAAAAPPPFATLCGGC